METLEVPIMALRISDHMKVGMERYEQITGIDRRDLGTVKVTVSSGIVYEFGYSAMVTVSANPIRPRPVSHRLGTRRSSTPCQQSGGGVNLEPEHALLAPIAHSGRRPGTAKRAAPKPMQDLKRALKPSRAQQALGAA